MGVAQTGAIARYCGKQGGFYPRDDDLAAAKIDEIIDTATDITMAIGRTFGMADAEKMAAWAAGSPAACWTAFPPTWSTPIPRSRRTLKRRRAMRKSRPIWPRSTRENNDNESAFPLYKLSNKR